MSNITEEYVEEYIRELLPDHQGQLKVIEESALENQVPIVHKEVAALLKVITKASSSKKILEVGTAVGYSSILLCQAAGDGAKVTTIERNEKRAEEARINIETLQLSNSIQVIEGDAQEVLNFLEGTYDLIFLDGAKGHYKEMLEQCTNLLKIGGILVSDNILFKGMVANDDLVVRRKRTIVNRMREYLQYICNHPQLDTSIIPIGDGVAISYKRLEE
ncbi:O-methyltransferase YrrM [Clostridium aceticum]|uniref:tRNA 5-hydroxyuridine methyltransferase n=1 Tax=Clostridium aceticum TaxID=84022 RepID=A0A0D8ICV0_9CLOT|nr:O-methyltransferase [Clostridium aceticum]AKL95263.1 O-methyltransferase YrrM [Clostridium aceticum]KJF28113.1 methyltransferase [Clostridium aceticum]